MYHIPQGLFIVFEGIDGAGTTTQMALLAERLRKDGVPVHTTAEPTRGPVGQLLRSLLAGAYAPFDPTAMALLFAADRHDHLAREITPQRMAGVHVLCDRYLLSSLVYQQAAGVGRETILSGNGKVLVPDLTLLLTVDTEIAAARRKRRGGGVEIYETDETQRKVAAAYRIEAERMSSENWGHIVTLDGGGLREEVAEAVYSEFAAIRKH